MNYATVIATALALAGAAATAQAATPLTKSTVIECTTALCGGFPANNATMSMDSGFVSVAPSGLVTVSIVGLRDKNTGQVEAFKQLGLFFGTLFQQVNATMPLGNLTTDAQGNYSGPVTKSNGHVYKFAPGSIEQGSFYINDASIPNTQFATGFTVQ